MSFWLACKMQKQRSHSAMNFAWMVAVGGVLFASNAFVNNPQTLFYVVKEGDSLGAILRSLNLRPVYGAAGSLNQLSQCSRLQNTNTVAPGTVIYFEFVLDPRLHKYVQILPTGEIVVQKVWMKAQIQAGKFRKLEPELYKSQGTPFRILCHNETPPAQKESFVPTKPPFKAEPAPVPVSVPEPAPVPVSVPEPAPVLVSVPEPVPVLVSVPEPVPVLVSVPKPAPVLVSVPEPVPVPVSVPEPVPVPVSVPEPVPVPVQAPVCVPPQPVVVAKPVVAPPAPQIQPELEAQPAAETPVVLEGASEQVLSETWPQRSELGIFATGSFARADERSVAGGYAALLSGLNLGVDAYWREDITKKWDVELLVAHHKQAFLPALGQTVSGTSTYSEFGALGLWNFGTPSARRTSKYRTGMGVQYRTQPMLVGIGESVTYLGSPQVFSVSVHFENDLPLGSAHKNMFLRSKANAWYAPSATQSNYTINNGFGYNVGAAIMRPLFRGLLMSAGFSYSTGLYSSTLGKHGSVNVLGRLGVVYTPHDAIE